MGGRHNTESRLIREAEQSVVTHLSHQETDGIPKTVSTDFQVFIKRYWAKSPGLDRALETLREVQRRGDMLLHAMSEYHIVKEQMEREVARLSAPRGRRQ
jgi:hypothetical protein